VWNKKIPRADKNLTAKDCVCELHFLAEYIIKEKVFKEADGKDIQYELCKPKLVAEAIPTLFPNLPKYLSDKTMKRKPPTPRIPTTQTAN